MSLEKRIKGFVQLGLFLNQFKTAAKNPNLKEVNTVFYDVFEDLILRQKSYNGWFDKENVLNAITQTANSLTTDNIKSWLLDYDVPQNNDKIIGVIMAGNIPLVGFHDFLSVLITGNAIQAKLASGDNTLLKKIGEILVFIEPDFKTKINFVDKLQNFDAVIATGSNNTARYFEQYFGKYPHIIRKNRSSVAIINKNDTAEDILPLGNDIFQYYGLGCRSVSKLYFPEGYRIDTFFESILETYQDVTQNNKYANNYDYNKAVYLMGSNQLLDNGFVLLKEEHGRVKIAFDNHQKMTRSKWVSINQFHPFVKFLMDKKRAERDINSPPIATSISQYHIQEIEAGDYAFYVSRWSVQGVNTSEQLVYSISPIGSEQVITDVRAEKLINLTVVEGKRWEEASRVLKHDVILNNIDCCRDELDDLYGIYVDEAKRSNDDRADIQQFNIKKHYDRKITRLKDLIKEKERMNDTRMRPANLGRLAKLESRLAEQLESFDRKRKVEHDKVDVIMGVIHVN